MPAAGTFGNCARNVVNGPGINPNTTITSARIGRITSVSGTRNALGASGSRAIQIGARVDF